MEIKILFAAAAHAIREKGWVSIKQAEERKCRSTADEVEDLLARGFTPSAAESETAAAATQWIQGRAPRNLFERRLCDDMPDVSHACASMASYLQAKEWQTARETSQWQGAVGQRLEGIEVTVEKAERKGSRYFYEIADARGEASCLRHRYVTFSCRRLPIEVGDRVTIDGTVKWHGTYYRIKQTALNRVRIRKGRLT